AVRIGVRRGHRTRRLPEPRRPHPPIRNRGPATRIREDRKPRSNPMPDDPQLDSLKLPPHSLEAEQSVLGGLLPDNDAVDKVADVLADADFYSEAHRLIYAHILKLAAEAKPADVVTVSESLASVQKLEYVGGLAYLGALVQNVPTAANIRHYAH